MKYVITEWKRDRKSFREQTESKSSSRVPVSQVRTGNTGLSSVSLRVESGSPGWPHRSQSPPSSTGLQGASGCCSSCSGRPSPAPRGSCSPPSWCCCCRPPSRTDSSLRGSPCWPDTWAWPSPSPAPHWRGAAPSGWDGHHLGDTNQLRGRGPHSCQSSSRHLDTFTVRQLIFSFKEFLSHVFSAPPVTHSHIVSLPFKKPLMHISTERIIIQNDMKYIKLHWQEHVENFGLKIVKNLNHTLFESI